VWAVQGPDLTALVEPLKAEPGRSRADRNAGILAIVLNCAGYR
jgi:hypothetical protein